MKGREDFFNSYDYNRKLYDITFQYKISAYSLGGRAYFINGF
jgi:hypothetical protein